MYTVKASARCGLCAALRGSWRTSRTSRRYHLLPCSSPFPRSRGVDLCSSSCSVRLLPRCLTEVPNGVNACAPFSALRRCRLRTALLCLAGCRRHRMCSFAEPEFQLEEVVAGPEMCCSQKLRPSPKPEEPVLVLRDGSLQVRQQVLQRAVQI